MSSNLPRLGFLEHERDLVFADNLRLPIELATRASAVIGIRDSGKTNTGVVGGEELQEHGQQIVVIDPLDGWWGLKSSADGTKPAYPVVVLGGRHGDVPLNPGDGNVVADFAVDEGVSVILSLRHFESQADQRRLVTDFARRIFYRKGEVNKQTPLLVVIDECSLFVPQRVNAAEAPMVGAIQKLVRQGRSSGIGVMLIDQRPASISKDVLSQIELLIAHRCTSPHDLAALMKWVEQHDTEGRGEIFKKSLSTLPKGTAWIWSPGWLNLFKQAKIRMRRTFDSSATPKIGEVQREPKVKAEIDLEALKERLAATIERAKEDDPAALKARVKELEDKLKTETRRAVPQMREVVREIERIPTALYTELLETWRRQGKEIETLASERAEIGSRVSELEERVERLKETNNVLGTLVEKSRFAPNAVKENGKGGLERREEALGLHGDTAGDTDRKVSSLRGEKRVLAALAELGGQAAKTDLAVRACYKHSAGGFQNILSSLRSQRLIVSTHEGVELCGEGLKLQHAGLTTEQIRAEWQQKLDKPARLALEVLAHAHPKSLTKKEIAERTGYVASAGGFQNGLSQLRANGLVEGAKDLKLARVLA